MEKKKYCRVVQFQNEFGLSNIHVMHGTDYLCTISSNRKKPMEDAKIASEAFNAYNETGLTPSQLLEQRDELRVEMIRLEEVLNYHYKTGALSPRLHDSWIKIKSIIYKTK